LKKKIQCQEGFEDFKKQFPEYTGNNDPEPCRNYIKDKFLSLVPIDGNGLSVQTHHTCALDTMAMDAVFEAVKSTIMVKRLQGIGML